MDLFTKLYHSLTNASFYRQVVSTRLKSAFLYALGWYLLGSLLIGTTVNVFIAPRAMQSFQQISTHLQTNLPPELILQVSGNQLSVQNTATPLIISLPTSLSDTVINLAVVDPLATGEDITRYQTLLLLSQASVAVNNPTLNSPQIIPWEQLVDQDTQISSQDIENVSQSIGQTLAIVFKYRWLITPIVLFVIIFPLRLITVLIDTLLLSLTGNLMSRPLGYKNTLKITLHTAVTAEIIVLLLGLIYTDLPSIVTPLAFFGLSLIAIFSLPPIPSKPTHH